MALNKWTYLHPLTLSLLSGLLLTSAWPNTALTIGLLFAWVPLLLLAHQKAGSFPLLRYVALSLLIWNIGTTWWLWNSTGFGAVAAIVINTTLMCIPWWGFMKMRKYFSESLSLFALVVFWLTFEYVHLNWSISWPWLTLGNGLSAFTQYIQWYEYTGVGGGSLLIWIVNLLVFRSMVSLKEANKKSAWFFSSMAVLFIALLVIISQQLLPAKTELTEKTNVVVVQPNIDPYQKFESLTTEDQINRLVQLSVNAIDSNTVMVIWPETAMSAADWQDNIKGNQFYQPIFQFLAAHPSIQLISGIETFKQYGTTAATKTARKTNDGIYYDAFNAAVSLTANQEPVYYNKSKLVPGVESLPSFLRFMAPVFEQFGGSTGGYGVSDTAVVFKDPIAQLNAAPIICYESIYGEYVTNYVRSGASMLAIMTNDGWWGNTPGHQQHLFYAKLRAIETRRWVARSANTGISAFINPRGEIEQSLAWDKRGAIKMAIPAEQSFSFYVRYGDIIFKIAALFAAFFVVVYFYKKSTHAGKTN
ncbi:apolipoprotein N-acyltransferase [Sediminibacterium sp.]|uniref:apolipoprotein N-acyltransferase n=1 Tax=Sediminibacterium sp. TaxID=1917865 RepID=UPI0025D23112|nr:apolipoprotein N-acyltransferase [Sediminibacterium sp.]MBT9483020.1 apolipoprotein N-acyltransferase [Sediminibacterium sp.]